MLRKLYPSPIAFDRVSKWKAFEIDGNELALASGGVMGFQFQESSAVIITRVILDITTVSTGACTLDIGYTATDATTTSDTLLDGIDANAAEAVFDSMNAALDSGANAKAQRAAIGKWITVDEKSGDAEGLKATLFVEYFNVTTE